MSPSSEQVAVQSSGGAVRDAEPDGTVGLQVVLDRSLQAQYGELADSVHEQVPGCRRAEELADEAPQAAQGIVPGQDHQHGRLSALQPGSEKAHRAGGGLVRAPAVSLCITGNSLSQASSVSLMIWRQRLSGMRMPVPAFMTSSKPGLPL